jgi:phage N-6-adenine-methyltransferase
MNATMYSSANSNWETPLWLFKPLQMLWKLELDAASTDANHLCKLWFTPTTDALTRPWGFPTWCNPPYGRGVGEWVRKGRTAGKNVPVVMLLAARTDTKWFHESIMMHAHEICFIKGRVVFNIDGKPMLDKKGKPMPAPFPSMVVVWKPGGWLRRNSGPRFTSMCAI